MDCFSCPEKFSMVNMAGARLMICSISEGFITETVTVILLQ